jgi:AhpD family alkylhydroperoxidase
MPNALQQVQWEPCVLEPARDRELEALARRAYGVVPPHVPYLVPCPWLVRAMVDLNPDSGNLARLDYPLADLLAFVVSQENSCRYCFATSRWLLRVQGLSEARIDELQSRAAGTLDPPTAAAVAFARRMSRSQPVAGPADLAALRAAGFDDEQIREMAFVIAYTTFANRVTTIPAIPPYLIERLPGRWFFALLRLLMRRSVARHRRRGRRGPVAGSAAPFTRLASAFGDLPAAGCLVRVLEAQWASPGLSRRARALMFGVVARSLGCTHSLDEARQVLREEGVADATVDRALTHLQAPGLDAADNLLLGFARDSVWYTPARIQARARDVRARLGPVAFVEALGVVSLANALCRLAPVIHAG